MNRKAMTLANISNGLLFTHDGVCFFSSTHGHHMGLGYFRMDAMPWDAVIHLMRGGDITIIDATRKNKPLSDALRYGVPTWAMVYNRAIRIRSEKVCDWQTREMISVASSNKHRKLIRSYRKLAKYFKPERPAVIGENIKVVCYPNFQLDDQMEEIGQRV